MPKTEYKKGDVIHITGKNKKKLTPIIDEFIGVQEVLTHITSLYGRVTRALWDEIKKHYLRYHEFKLIIDEEKEDA